MSRYISHVVVIIQENRSFESFFAGYPGANAPTIGCGKHSEPSGVRARARPSSGCPQGDARIPLHQITFEHGPDLSHAYEASIVDWDNGRMDGFSAYGLDHDDAAYAYVERSEVATYWTMARQYVLADAMFPTEFGPSWTAHLTLVAGTDNLNNDDDLALADFAVGKDNCNAQPGTKTTTVAKNRVVRRASGPFPCLDQFNTMAQALDNAGISWKYYASTRLKSFIWSPFAAIKYVRDGPDWDANVVVPHTKVLSDIRKGQLASVSWVSPSRVDSDHPASHSDTGPSWVASIVNALGNSPYWSSTAIIVLWDDFGGFYDDAPPPQLDFRGLGIRVPCLIISPYARQGYVSHTRYEYGSILKFIEEAFPSVQPLGPKSEGYTDARANSLVDSFDFAQPARAFKTIPQKYPVSHFLREPPSDQPVDDE
ncbi:MAG: alkaline phosphatase family protein [Candidatus Baltobacteraceae bacterium]